MTTDDRDAASERERISKKMEEHYQRFWSEGDPWRFESSELDANRYRRQLELLTGRHYSRALDVGCGSGLFTRLLADVCDEVVGIDIASTAIAEARRNCADKTNVTLRAANVMELKPEAEGPWDLIVMSETIYCLGWLYPLFNVGWLIRQFYTSLHDGGRFLLVNTLGRETDYLLLPWLVRTYKDLFVNIGYVLEHEEQLRGDKNGLTLEILLTLFSKS